MHLPRKPDKIPSQMNLYLSCFQRPWWVPHWICLDEGANESRFWVIGQHYFNWYTKKTELAPLAVYWSSSLQWRQQKYLRDCRGNFLFWEIWGKQVCPGIRLCHGTKETKNEGEHTFIRLFFHTNTTDRPWNFQLLPPYVGPLPHSGEHLAKKGDLTTSISVVPSCFDCIQWRKFSLHPTSSLPFGEAWSCELIGPKTHRALPHIYLISTQAAWVVMDCRLLR